jgi:hypothetical protein
MVSARCIPLLKLIIHPSAQSFGQLAVPDAILAQRRGEKCTQSDYFAKCDPPISEMI